MTSEVQLEHRDGIAVLTLDRPVANALTPSVRAALSARLSSAAADPDVTAIVLRGAGNGFSAGVDITEYEGALAVPWVSDLCNQIELSPKPVVAALHGSALGAGFELALAAHARLAAADTRVALPEISLGLIPGGGGTQRAPRLVGAQVSLEFMLSGQAVSVGDPRMRRFFDQIVTDGLLDQAIRLAASLAASGSWTRTRDVDRGFSDPEAYQKAVSTVAGRLTGKADAEAEIVRCIEAAQLLPFERGLEFERTAFEDRVRSDLARGARHIFASERRAAVMPEVTQGAARTVRSVALLGSGPILPELAIALLDAGKEVHLAVADRDVRAAVSGRVQRVYDTAVARGRLTGENRDDRLSRLLARDDYAALGTVDAVFDSGGALTGIDMPRLKEGAVWVNLEAAGGHALGCRIHRPAHSARLVEVLVPEGGNAENVATLVQMFTGMGRTVVRCTQGAGSVCDALSVAIYRAALVLNDAGFTPYEIDEAARDLGFAAGPFQMIDAEGLQGVRQRIETCPTMRGGVDMMGGLVQRLTEGATGRNVGRGFYEYRPDGARPVAALSHRIKHPEAHVTDIGCAKALHAAIVNEAARLLSVNAVQRASDLDVVMVKGLGYDRGRGGPLLQADLRGIFSMMKDMKILSPVAQDLWTPQPMIEEMVKNGEAFFGRAGYGGNSA